MNLTGREILVFVLVVFAVLVGGLLLLGLFWGFSGMGLGMMGPMMGSGMMGGFGIFWWLLACLIPLGLIALLAGGAIWLLVSASGSQRDIQPLEQHCPNCNRSVQSDWQICPYCGTPLRGEET